MKFIHKNLHNFCYIYIEKIIIMKKYLLSILTTLFIIPGLFSQNLQLSDASGPISNGGEINIGGDTGVTITAYVYVKNTTSTSMDVKVKKVEVSLKPGSNNYFCWGSCFSSSVYVSPLSISIPANTLNSTDFSGDYEAKGNIGTSVIRYVFFDANNPSDTAYVNVNYDAQPVGITEINPDEIIFSDAFPNPANINTTIKYGIPKNANSSRVIIRDLLGNTVKEFHLSDDTGKLLINTSDMKAGIYFYSLVINDRIYKSKKLIIKD